MQRGNYLLLTNLLLSVHALLFFDSLQCSVLLVLNVVSTHSYNILEVHVLGWG